MSRGHGGYRAVRNALQTSNPAFRKASHRSCILFQRPRKGQGHFCAAACVGKLQGAAVSAGSLPCKEKPQPQMPLLGAAGVAGKEGLFPFGQSFRRKAGAGIFHCNDNGISFCRDRKGNLTAGRGVAHGIVQQVAHRPVQAGAVYFRLHSRHRIADKINLLHSAETLPDPLPALCQGVQSDGFLCFRGGIRQGKTYYQTQDNAFRENQMAANLISAFEALPDGTSIMVITGSAHSNLYGMDVIGTVPCLANQLRQAYGRALTAWNYSAALDYTRSGQTASIRMNGQLYSVVCLADQDLSALLPGYRSRTFWLVSDAYEAVKNLPLTGDVLPYNNYPYPVQPGQVFVLDYALSDGSALRLFYRADGTSYQGAPTTVGFEAG